VRIDHGFQLAIENCKSFASVCFGGEVGVGGLSLSRTCGGIAMKRAIAFTLFASAAVGFAQQNKDPVSSVVKEILPHQETNLVAAAEEMPADKFGYKPTPQQMSFATLVMHICKWLENQVRRGHCTRPC
jgi:hypothetical protein